MNIKVKAAAPGEDAWDSRALGAEEEFVGVMPEQSAELDAALDLHPISIRLQKSLVDNLKALAHINGLGYQPLVRQILTRWVDSELKQMVALRAQSTTSVEGQPCEPAKRGAEATPARHKKAA